MASSFSTDLKLELMVTGENAGTWGDKTNTNLNLLQQAIAGYQEVNIAGSAQTTTLVMSDAALSNARNAVIKLTGTITGNQVVTVPDGIEKTYTIFNGTTGAFTVEFKTASGTGPTFSTTDKGIKLVYSDGTNVVDILTGPLSAVTIGGNLSVDGGTIKLDGNYPVGTNNVALGDGALDDASLTGGCNIAIGASALTVNTTGCANTAIGRFSLFSNTTGISNTAVGITTMCSNTTGCNNTAVGANALLLNTTANENTALGFRALCTNTTGCQNTAVGNVSLALNETGCQNTAVGRCSLTSNTTGNCNTAVGLNSLALNTTGCQNTAVGSLTLDANTTGNNSVAVGVGALGANTTGCNNTAVGLNSLCTNTTGNNNTAVGLNSLLVNTTACFNTALGNQSMQCNTTGASNVAMGYLSLFANTTASENVAVGNTSLFCNTTGCVNTAVGSQALDANTTGNFNTALGFGSLGANTTGASNTAVGICAGSCITTGACNTILGAYIGNSCGLDISAGTCNAILSDGRGQPYVVSRTNGTRFLSDNLSAYSPAINSAVTVFTNLSTVNQTINKPNLPGGNTFVYTIFMQNIDNDQATWSLSMGREDAVTLRLTAYGAANCSITETSEGVFAVTGLGDGRTYTFTFDTGFASFSLKASSLATGSTIVSILGIGAL